MKHTVTPASDWPVGRKVELLDAYFRNPVNVRITRHANDDHVVSEDERGIVYFARTDRITGFTDDPVEDSEDEFADILG